MSGSVQITVNDKELEKCEKKLAALYKNIANRRVKIRFTDARGAVVEELQVAEEQLNDIGRSLATLIRKTEKVVSNTRATFAAADDTLAQCFSVTEE